MQTQRNHKQRQQTHQLHIWNNSSVSKINYQQPHMKVKNMHTLHFTYLAT